MLRLRRRRRILRDDRSAGVVPDSGAVLGGLAVVVQVSPTVHVDPTAVPKAPPPDIRELEAKHREPGSLSEQLSRPPLDGITTDLDVYPALAGTEQLSGPPFDGITTDLDVYPALAGTEQLSGPPCDGITTDLDVSPALAGIMSSVLALR